MRFYHTMKKNETPEEKPERTGFLSVLAIPATAIVALLGFWKLSPGWTFIIALAALIILVILFWIEGKPED